mgnify:CR=1 FL=1
MTLKKVWAVGRDTYVRVYPNPGIGVRVGNHRVALSLYGGLEVFRRHPTLVWQRIWSLGSRVQRPGSRG